MQQIAGVAISDKRIVIYPIAADDEDRSSTYEEITPNPNPG
jgi:hypothetical protein